MSARAAYFLVDFRDTLRNLYVIKVIKLLSIALVIVGFQFPTLAFSQSAPISSKAFVDVPDSFDAALSPDGTEIAIVQSRWESEVVRDWDQIKIVSARGDRATRLTMDRKDRVIDWIVWPKKDRLIAHIITIGYTRRGYNIYDQIVSIDTKTGAEKPLKSIVLRRLQGKYRPARIVSYGSVSSPEIFMSIPDGKSNDLTALNVYSGASRLIERGTSNTVDWEIDRDGKVELRIDVDPDTAISRYFAKDEKGKEWLQIAQILPTQEYDFEVVAPSHEAGKFFVIARPEKSERRGLYLYNILTKEYEKKIYEHDKFDLAGAFVSGRPKEYIGSYYYDHTLKYSFEDKALNDVAIKVNSVLGPEKSWSILDSDEGGNNWLIYASGPQDAGAYWFFDHEAKSLTKVIDARNDLPSENLAPMTVFDWSASDGLPLSGYITRPKNPTANSPLIVMPHGGPEARDILGFEPWAQFFASNGYIVFQPNFRGSDGFGRSFAQAGWRQWGKKMRTDIEDGVDKIIRGGGIDTNNIFFVGASYGGYAALNAATQPDSRYSCITAIAGVSDLNEFIKFQEARTPFLGKDDLVKHWKDRIGDPASHEIEIKIASPINNISQLNAPLLLVHGKLDAIVPPDQSIRMEAAVKSANKQVELHLLDNEGHSNWDEDTQVRVLSSIAYFMTKCKIANESKARQVGQNGK